MRAVFFFVQASEDTLKRTIGDITADMVSGQTVGDIWAVFCDAMEERHFNRMIYAATRFPGHTFTGNLDEALILLQGPLEYADEYIGNELYLHSPSYAFAEHNTGFVSWPEAARMFSGTPTPKQIEIWQLNARFGVIAGYVGSLNGIVPAMNGVIGMGAAPGIDQTAADEIWAESGAEIETLAKMMHVRVAGLPHTDLLRPLTSRQKEVLDWYGKGKTVEDIAVIIGLSKATVEKHLRSARDSLDATTSAHAVRKAMSMNLLSA